MKIGKAFKAVVGGIAPTIAAGLGGPFAGIAMKFLADKFTGGDTGEVEDFLLAADPTALKDLKVADMEFRTTLRELDIRVEELHQKDRSSARELAARQGMTPQILLSAIFVVGYFGIVIGLMAGWILLPVGQESLLAGLIGVLTAGTIKIMDFWFGSSAGSKSKTAALAHAANGNS